MKFASLASKSIADIAEPPKKASLYSSVTKDTTKFEKSGLIFALLIHTLNSHFPPLLTLPYLIFKIE